MRKTLIFLISTLFLCIQVSGQNSCSTGKLLTSLPFFESGSTCSGPILAPPIPCGTNSGGKVTYYRIRLNESKCVTIDITRSGNRDVMMYAALTSYCAPSECIYAAQEEEIDKLHLSVCLEKDTMYTLMLYSSKTASSLENPTPVTCFEYNITMADNSGQGDPCPAVEINSLNYSDTVRNSCEGTNILPATGCGEGKKWKSKDFVYKYTAKPGDDCLSAEVNASTGGTYFGVFDGCPSSGNCLTTAEIDSGKTSISDFKVEPGKTYYFSVSSSWMEDNNCVVFNFHLRQKAPKVEDCPNAMLIDVPLYKSTFNMRCRDFPYGNLNNCQFSLQHNAVFYKVVATGNQCLTVQPLATTGQFVPSFIYSKGVPIKPGPPA